MMEAASVEQVVGKPHAEAKAKNVDAVDTKTSDEEEKPASPGDGKMELAQVVVPAAQLPGGGWSRKPKTRI